MNTQYTVITDNGGGPNQIYHDIAGEIYTFPPMYRNKLTPGTQSSTIGQRKRETTRTSPIDSQTNPTTLEWQRLDLLRLPTTGTFELKSSILSSLSIPL